MSPYVHFFSNEGVPVKLWSDNGRQFAAAEFKTFLKDWDIVGGTSSPHYAQSNGRAVVEVKTTKKLINGCSTSGSFDADKFAKAILLFGNTPRLGGASPAQAIFNRPARDSHPAHRRAFAAEWQKVCDTLEKKSRRAKDLQIEHFNKNAHPLPPLKVGNHVLIHQPTTEQWTTPGVVVEVGINWDYITKTDAGQLFRRNRRFLRRRSNEFWLFCTCLCCGIIVQKAVLLFASEHVGDCQLCNWTNIKLLQVFS